MPLDNLFTRNNQFTGQTRGGRLTGGSRQPSFQQAQGTGNQWALNTNQDVQQYFRRQANNQAMDPISASLANQQMEEQNRRDYLNQQGAYAPPTPQAAAATPVQAPVGWGAQGQGVTGYNDYVNAMLGLSNVQTNAQLGLIGDQRGLLQRDLDLSNTGSRLSAQGNRLGLDERGINLDQQAWQANQILQNFGRDKSFLDRMLALQGQLTDQQRRQIGIDDADIATQLARSRRQLNNEYQARGAWFAPERGLSRRDLDVTAYRNVGRNAIRTEGTLTQDLLNQLEYDKSFAGLTDRQAGAGADLGFIGRMRDILQQRYGLNDQQLANALAGNQLNYDQSNLRLSSDAQNLYNQLLQNALDQWFAGQQPQGG